ncbi:hypothetical protein FIU87_21145 [Bacillus sp. THAF10]|nr:hypothetical protein FIU87_21145 [Bacillus sp. THAF10]
MVMYLYSHCVGEAVVESRGRGHNFLVFYKMGKTRLPV